ncbi:MAG: SusF/SusE family outer membrane protein [Prevotella sp.]|nr:SusF/SusE family outer membrane protein [Prevotella sp.]
MKHIFKFMLLPALALPLLFTSCEKDDDSNPVLDISHATDGFVLNVPANAANNTYDLASAENLTLTCSQPNYGGIPYVTRYFVQVAIDEAFLTNPETAHKELTTTYTTAKMAVDAAELNDSIVKLFQEANPDTDYPDEARPVYIRLRALIDGINTGESFSNVITLPSVKATYIAPPAVLPTEVFVVGSSIQTAWSSWKPLAPVYGLSGEFYTMIYVPAGGEFKWGTANNDWRGYDRLKEIIDNAGAGVSEGDNSNIKIANAGWYVLNYTAETVGSSVQFTLKIQPGKAYVIGNAAGGSWTDADAAWELTAPANASGQWVSPAFTASGELRAYIKVPGFDWWRTEFTLDKTGALYWRLVDIPNNWAEAAGADYSVSCSAGQKLYVDFDNNTGEVK